MFLRPVPDRNLIKKLELVFVVIQHFLRHPLPAPPHPDPSSVYDQTSYLIKRDKTKMKSARHNIKLLYFHWTILVWNFARRRDEISAELTFCNWQETQKVRGSPHINSNINIQINYVFHFIKKSK